MAHHDLLIIGAGSGNSVIGPELDGWDVAIAEPWVFGGTCLNRGCIPSKMLVHAADLALAARHAPALGVHTTFEGVDWPAIRDRIFGRIDPIAESGLEYRHSLDHVGQGHPHQPHPKTKEQISFFGVSRGIAASTNWQTLRKVLRGATGKAYSRLKGLYGMGDPKTHSKQIN